MNNTDSTSAQPATSSAPASEKGSTATATEAKATNVDTREFSLEDITVEGDTVLPVRGTITTSGKSNSPLIIISHLRSFNCSDETFAYPCAKDAKEVRLDKGMAYLAKTLGQAGYTVVVPDLGPLWAPDELDKPYDQTKAWMATMDKIRRTLADANEGKTTLMGKALKGNIDLEHTGLFMHSRSAIVANDAAKAWPGVSLVSYGGFYALPETDEDEFAPAPPDVPLLVIDGEADQDVDRAGASWLPEYVALDRTAPAFSVIVPGLGHNFINTTLSEKEFDDRTVQEATAEDHQKFLSTAVVSWFDQTIRQAEGPFPMSAGGELPDTVGGLDARVFAVTPNTGDKTARRWVATATGPKLEGAEVTYCRNYPLMNPMEYPDRCELAKLGMVHSSSLVARFELSDTPVSVPVTAEDAQSVIVHVMPSGSRKDKKDTALDLTLVTDGGERIAVAVPAGNQALRDRQAKNNNGEYWIETLRLPLPPEAEGKTITSVELTGQGSIDLRAVELF
ncbi:hypothetical protein [Corynebacterium phocae]|uniref:hypothetical protein n=1 Tax=Corynebacterium phocae TaxID=161895 RepID=UPI0012397C8F|nr:hypothetical protein [Corynebacterium phocae]